MKKKLFLTAILTLLCCTLLIAGASATLQGTGTADDPYKISSAEELYWFAGLVNGDASIIDSVEKNTGAWAVLTDNITIQKIEWGSDGSLSNTPTYEWTPIGSGNNGYTGTFDGQGHTISGLYCSVEGGYAGLFGVVNSGTVKNVNITDSYFKTTDGFFDFAGGVCGMINSPNGKITNCSFSGSGDGYVGGVCGYNLGGEDTSAEITNCYNIGSVIGGDNSSVGGVCGKNEVYVNNSSGNHHYAEITNCYNNGSVSGSGYVGGVCGKNEDNNEDNDCIITNCLWLDTVADNGVGLNEGQGTVTNVESLTAARFASGEAAYLLNRAEGGVWTVGEDGYPVLSPDQKIVVYKVTVDGVVYGASDEGFKLPAAPSKPGYIFMGWRSGDMTYLPGDEVGLYGDTTFTAVWANMPDIKPEEPDEPDKLPFTDVSEGAWYYDAVKTVYEAGLMNGVTDTLFDPDGTLTRAMFWTILARAGGASTDGGATWYAVAQQWAIDNGVSDGADAMGALTREQLVTMLWRLNGEPVVNYLITTPDANQISPWALEAMRWAASTGLIQGDESGNLTPTATCTRAQAATFLVRYLTTE